MSFVLISHCSSTSLAGKVSYEANGPDFDFRVWVEDCAYEAHLLEQHGIGGLIQVKASVRLSACTFAMITIPQLAAQALGSFLATETRGRFGSSSRFIMSIAPSCLHWIVSTPTRISTPRIARAIEYTRVPYKVPSSDDDLNEEEGFLLRAADLIGQLGDPNYMRKSNALFYEFEEDARRHRLQVPAILLDHRRAADTDRDTLPQRDLARSSMDRQSLWQCLPGGA
jgi:hypothetical protein